MADRRLAYSLYIGVPWNEETTRLYSENKELNAELVQETLDKIQMIIEREGFITFERVCRILKLKAHPECPHILFTDIDGYEFGPEVEGEDEELLTLWMTNSYELYPVTPPKVNPEKPAENKAIPLKQEENKEGEEEGWQNSQKETSESGENGKT